MLGQFVITCLSIYDRFLTEISINQKLFYFVP